MTGITVPLTLVALGLLYWFPVRRWYRRWGATAADLERVMSGDLEISEPTYETTVAISIAARPEHIWPWLVQMGYRRGGLYSYDWLDRLFGFLDGPSAERIVPELQHLEAGDVIPVGAGPGFPVIAVDPPETLLLGGESDGVQWTWQFALYPIDDRRTRLVLRNRARGPHTAGAALFVCVLEPAAFIMTRKMLLGLRRRAEALAVEQHADAFSAA